MEKKQDCRVKRTKEQLRTALAQMLMMKPLSKITVKELVDTAGINRSTFYLHYSDVEDLLHEIENEILQEMQAVVENHPIDLEKHTAVELFRGVFQVLEKYREIGNAFLGENGDIRFLRKVEKILEESSRPLLMEVNPDSTEKLKYFYSFCMQGCFGFTRTWLETEEDMTAEEAAEMAYQMVFSAMKAFCITAGKETKSIHTNKER